MTSAAIVNRELPGNSAGVSRRGAWWAMSARVPASVIERESRLLSSRESRCRGSLDLPRSRAGRRSELARRCVARAAPPQFGA